MSSLPAPLDGYLEATDRNVERFEALVDGLDDAAFNWSADDTSWSIGQNVKHMVSVNRAYLKGLETAVEQAASNGPLRDDKAVRYNWFERYFIASMEPPPKRRFKAPKAVVPVSDLEMDATCARYRETCERLKGVIVAAGPIHLRKTRVASPLASWLKFSVGGALALLTTHDRRHLWQAEQVKAAPGFPS